MSAAPVFATVPTPLESLAVQRRDLAGRLRDLDARLAEAVCAEIDRASSGKAAQVLARQASGADPRWDVPSFHIHVSSTSPDIARHVAALMQGFGSRKARARQAC